MSRAVDSHALVKCEARCQPVVQIPCELTPVSRLALGDTSVGAVVVGEAVVEAGELDIVVVRGALLCKLGVSGCLTHLDTQG